jgi:catechol 2,3-dioxygenase-like lactoylglutathione lyase family enzyme
MASRIKHVAIVSHNVDQLGRFYATLFGMKSAGERMPGAGAAVVSDGYVGMNVNGRANGRQGGFDHFGIEVDDVELIQARVAEKYPNVHLLKRPSSRPFAGISMHDPAGNVFDLSHKAMENRRDVYADDEEQHPRHIDHFMLRTVDAPGVARFYREVFDLQERDKPADDPNTYLTDGKVTLIVAPWRIADYAGSGIERPALDHLGFRVENLAQFKSDLDQMIENDPTLAPRAFRPGEGDIRLKLLQTCRYGEFHFADPDGVLLEVSEGGPNP